MSSAMEVNESNFDAEVLKSNLPVLVDFYAEWCGPCKMMGPVLDQVSTQLENKIKVTKLDTDQSQQIATKYQITGIPCLILIKNGEEVKRITGYQSADALISQIEPLI
jgi:thioredoxin 1